MDTDEGMNLQFAARAANSRQWIVWFMAMFGTIVILTLAFYMAPNAWFLTLTLLVIVGFFLATLVKSYVDVRFLDNETRLASDQVRQLAEVNDVTRFLEISRPSIFRSHIESLYRIFKSHTEIQQDSLIEVTHARLIARNKVVELFSSILITLGLIGTIVGLIMSVGGLSQTLESSSSGSEDIFAGMLKTVKGLETAFYTTLLGALSGGVILRILTNVVDSAILRYMAHLAELTEVNVLPPLRRMAIQLEKSGYYRNLDS